MPDTAELTAGSAVPGSTPSLAVWLDDLSSGFDRAADVAGVTELRLRIADAPVLVRFAGERLAEQLGRAFEHLAADPAEEPVLTILAWDSEQSGAAPPPLPVLDGSDPRGTTFYASDEGRRLASRPMLGQLTAYDPDRKTGWFWCRSGRELPFWERAAPFRQLLHWWLPESGKLLVHGAAVGHASGGLLLVGRGGSGKSTCALSTLTSPLLYAGDDYVAVDTGPEPRVLSLYCSGKLVPAHAPLLPHLPPPSFVGDGSVEEKSVFYVAERFAERMCDGFPLRAVVAPRIHGTAPAHAPAGPAEALAALAPSTLLQLVPAEAGALSAMAGLLERIPAYRLDVGGSVELVPAALERLLEEVQR
ncbi:MAG: hypothetical protein ACJ75G_12065 [Gaiellaceae bacterium]